MAREMEQILILPIVSNTEIKELTPSPISISFLVVKRELEKELFVTSTVRFGEERLIEFGCKQKFILDNGNEATDIMLGTLFTEISTQIWEKYSHSLKHGQEVSIELTRLQGQINKEKGLKLNIDFTYPIPEAA